MLALAVVAVYLGLHGAVLGEALGDIVRSSDVTGPTIDALRYVDPLHRWSASGQVCVHSEQCRDLGAGGAHSGDRVVAPTTPPGKVRHAQERGEVKTPCELPREDVFAYTRAFVGQELERHLDAMHDRLQRLRDARIPPGELAQVDRLQHHLDRLLPRVRRVHVAAQRDLQRCFPGHSDAPTLSGVVALALIRAPGTSAAPDAPEVVREAASEARDRLDAARAGDVWTRASRLLDALPLARPRRGASRAGPPSMPAIRLHRQRIEALEHVLNSDAATLRDDALVAWSRGETTVAQLLAVEVEVWTVCVALLEAVVSLQADGVVRDGDGDRCGRLSTSPRGAA